MILTAEQITQNRAAAVVAVRAALGLSDTPSDWSYEQRLAYNKALATYIAARPEQFSDKDLTNAEYIGNQNATPLEDDSFDWGMFATETARPAGEALASVGNGVLSVANAAKWAIPVAALVIGVLLLAKVNKDLGSPVTLPKP